jgi:hypothetical protein
MPLSDQRCGHIYSSHKLLRILNAAAGRAQGNRDGIGASEAGDWEERTVLPPLALPDLFIRERQRCTSGWEQRLRLLLSSLAKWHRSETQRSSRNQIQVDEHYRRPRERDDAEREFASLIIIIVLALAIALADTPRGRAGGGAPTGQTATGSHGRSQRGGSCPTERRSIPSHHSRRICRWRSVVFTDITKQAGLISFDTVRERLRKIHHRDPVVSRCSITTMTAGSISIC